MKKKLKLSDLKIESFVTTIDKNNANSVKGGWSQLCPTNDRIQNGCQNVTYDISPCQQHIQTFDQYVTAC